MSDDLQQLKIVNEWLLDRVSARFPCSVRQYTMVEFNDPPVGPSYNTSSRKQFADFFNDLVASGGGDCPEYTIQGLELALETSPPHSFILVLTDASAKDYNESSTVNHVYSLINTKQSQVYFLITGLCSDLSDPQFLIYRDIAASSFGHVFQVSLSDLGKVFNHLDFTLSRPVNSSIRLFSGDFNSNGTHSESFKVAQKYNALIITTDGFIPNIRVVGPDGVEAQVKQTVSETWGSMSLVKNPLEGIWILHIQAGSPHSVRVEGFTAANTSSTAHCSECHTNATCEEYLGIRECSCKDGFIGDGFSCSDIDECAYSWSYNCSLGYCVNTIGSYDCRCSTGYTMVSGHTCIDIDECSRPDLNQCHPQAICRNYNGYYTCRCSNGYYGDGYHCEINECRPEPCAFGKECIKTFGSHFCSDPCFNHTVLNEFWRSTSYGAGSNCDNGKKGWYRFTGSGGTRMLESCVPTHTCNTHAPVWLKGAHPVDADGIVNRTACAHWKGNCCHWSTTVQIKSCPGGYHVYKLNGTPVCSLTYCTDPSYTDSSCHCTADEECKLVNGTLGCYCKNNHGSYDVENLRPALKCGNNELKVSFPMCQLENLALNPKSIHLRDSSCVGFEERNYTNLFSLVTSIQERQCGTESVKNQTHVTYTNIAYLPPRVDTFIVRDKEVKISFSCTYPLDMKLSLETALRPMMSTVNISVGGTGQFIARMALYKDQNYISPYEGSEVVLSTTAILYVGAVLEVGDTSQFVLVLKNCYATPTRNSTDPMKYLIIKDSCPNKQDPTIRVAENGVSIQGRFSIQLFKFVGDYDLVYLHCEIHLCDTKATACAPTCSGLQSRRSAVEADYSVVVGPIVRKGALPSPFPLQSGSFGICAPWTLLTSAIITLAHWIIL
ncbi:uromodulin [Microcaecilia unicolor]|uniref:Uromodulin n=1 Tax=Microcaecilia unicolor TaxID=1415580 RepID=A0A6P7YKE2_9AMPH|nr:uromodulin [Microcaecilia unicolor]